MRSACCAACVWAATILNGVYEVHCLCQLCYALDRRLAQAMQLQTQQTRSVGNLPVKTDK